jgi:hypothetical protein
MPVTSKTSEQRSSAAVIKEHRARDASQAMREIEAHRVAVLAKTARLRAARLAKEAEAGGAAPKKKSSPKKAT